MELFKKVLKQCIDNGMISGRRQAVDGVYIKANAAMHSMLEKSVLADAETYNQELDANEEAQVAAAPRPGNKKKGLGSPTKGQPVRDANEEVTILKLDPEKAPVSPDSLHFVGDAGQGPSIATVVQFDDNRKDGLEITAEPIDKPHPRAKTHYSPADPDARLSTKRGKIPALNYLGEISVDTATHMITHIQVFLADKRDSQCLPPMLANMVGNLKENDIIVEEVTADAGFSSGKALRALEAMGITGYIPNNAAFHYEHEGFVYHTEGDHFECRNGKKLTYLGTYDDKKRYRRTRKNCMGCPFEATCIGDKQEMAINETIYKPYLDRMHVRMETRKAKIVMKKRQSTVEPVIGSLVGNHGMKKINSKGLAQANKCLTMAAVAYNIKKLLNYKPKRVHENIHDIAKGINNGIWQLLFVVQRLFMGPMPFIS